MRKLTSLAMSLVLICAMFFAFPLSASALSNVTTEAELTAALIGPDPDINIVGDISSTGDIEIPAGKNFSVASGYTLSITLGHTLTNKGNVYNHGEIVIDGELINDGAISNYYSLENSGTFKNTGTLYNVGLLLNLLRITNNGFVNNDGIILDAGYIEGTGSIDNPPPNITTPGLMSAVQNEAYTAKLTATGSPTLWEIDASTPLPPGLSLNSSTGVISGTPSAEGYYDFVVSAENAHGTHFIDLSIYIFKPEEVTEFSFEPGFNNVTDKTKPVKGTIQANYSNDFWNGDNAFLFINGEMLEWDKDATHEEGSVIITLNPSFLQTLSNGSYPVEVLFGYGNRARTTLTVAVPGQTTTPPTTPTATTTTSGNPKTGDDINMPLLLMLSLISIAGIATTTIWRRKRTQ